MARIMIDIGEGGDLEAELPQMISVGDVLEIKGQNEQGETNNSVLLVVKACYVTPQKLYRNEEWLRNAYLTEEKTMAELGSMFNVSPMTICTWLEKFGIETRSRGRRK
jgi:hypothetical protein